MESYDIAVIGAGAAGMMCAAVAAQYGRRVVLIDHAERLAEKIRISGGGRCNFTNINARPANFLSANPHFCRSALARYTPRDFLALLKHHRVNWHEKHKGQLFCDDSSESIIDVLKGECDAGGVAWRRPVAVDRRSATTARASRSIRSAGTIARARSCRDGRLVDPEDRRDGFRLSAREAVRPQAHRYASGPRAAHVRSADWAPFAALSGLSLPVRISTGTGRGARRIRRRPAAYASRPVRARRAADFELLESVGADSRRPAARRRCRRRADRSQSGQRKNRSAIFWPNACPRVSRTRGSMRSACPQTRAWPICPTARLRRSARRCRGWTLTPSGTEGYRKAEVTRGGVDTRELSSTTMMSERVPGLYFIGEAVDVTGWLGGYNFQWAWASGVAAGKAAAEYRARARRQSA